MGYQFDKRETNYSEAGNCSRLRCLWSYLEIRYPFLQED
nr:MAG TPA: hypothetical protein [Caudoviricetes sp.]